MWCACAAGRRVARVKKRPTSQPMATSTPGPWGWIIATVIGEISARRPACLGLPATPIPWPGSIGGKAPWLSWEWTSQTRTTTITTIPSGQNTVAGPSGLVNCGNQTLPVSRPGIAADCAGISDAWVSGQMLVAGTTANANWNHLLDQFAAGLADLQNSGITIIMKTIHEQNDGNIWWEAGMLSDSTRRALFKYIESYFNNVKGLHNLLWAYVTDGSSAGDETGDTQAISSWTS
jgi:Glycosyl hydrolase family 26